MNKEPPLMICHSGSRAWAMWLWRWVPVIVWMTAIFIVSAQPTLPRVEDTLLDVVLKKTGHFMAYAILAGLIWRASGGVGGRPIRAVLIWAFTLLYAATDEWHQTFVPGRHGTPVDLLIDATGAACCVIILWCREGRRVRKD